MDTIQTCLTMKLLFGMALRQTNGFVESRLRLIGPDWEAPDFSPLNRRPKARAVNIPYRSLQRPLPRLIDSPRIKVVGEWDRRATAGNPGRRVHKQRRR